MDKDKHIEVTDLLDEFEQDQEIEDIKQEISEIDKILKDIESEKEKEDGR